MTDFCEINGENYQALFVNAEKAPDEYEPLHYYGYVEVENRLHFSRLFRLTYLQTADGFGIRHSLFQWLPVEVKPHCQLALKNQIDAAKGFREFLIPTV